MPPAEKFSIPGEEGVVFPGSAGLEISGTFWPGEGSTPRPGVLLLHMAYRERGDWRGLAGRLTHAGFAVLAIDLRGHGKTGGEIVWEAMPEDVQAAWKYLAGRPEVDPQRTFVIGASAGANLALLLGAAEPSITGVALLSASLDFFGLATGEAVKAYGKRPLLIVASQGDTYSAEGSRELARLAKGDVALKIYDGAVHGTDLLSSQPGLEGFLLEWLKKKAND